MMVKLKVTFVLSSKMSLFKSDIFPFLKNITFQKRHLFQDTKQMFPRRLKSDIFALLPQYLYSILQKASPAQIFILIMFVSEFSGNIWKTLMIVYFIV